MREADISMSQDDIAAMGIEDLVATTRDAGLVGLDEIACHGNGAVLEIEVEDRIEGFDEIEYVTEWEYVAETDRGHLYLISFTAPAVPEDVETWTDGLVGTCDPTVDGEGAELSLVGEQSTIAALLRAYREVGISPDLERLGSYAGDRRPLDRLTSRQREVLRTAFEDGYYDVPRGAGTEDIAAALELDPSTVAEHLQRAERNLLGELL